MAVTDANDALETTNRSDFTWPFLAERQRIFDWDRYEYKQRDPDVPVSPPSPTRWLFQNAETLKTMPNSQKLSFDFDFRPKPILSRGQSVAHHPNKKVFEHIKANANARYAAARTRPRVFKCPQISLDDVSTEKRDAVMAFVYTTSKTMSELTSGVSGVDRRSIAVVDVPSKPFDPDPGEFRLESLNETINTVKDLQSLYEKTINAVKTWRCVSTEWDEKQRRIFGGRSVD